MFDGYPSITTPMAVPWLSPNEVMVKFFPMLFLAISFRYTTTTTTTTQFIDLPSMVDLNFWSFRCPNEYQTETTAQSILSGSVVIILIQGIGFAILRQ